jgi:hypothetical protein
MSVSLIYFWFNGNLCTIEFIMRISFLIYAFNKFVCLASYVKGYPLDLSILLSGGKETKRDSPSNGERRGKSPSLNRVGLG